MVPPPSRRTTDRPLQQRAVRTRDNLLTAGAVVFERSGYSAATLEEIVAQAHATKGALYFHFRSKADLARAVVTAHQEASAEIGAELAASELNGLDALGSTIRTVAKTYQTSPIARAGARLSSERDVIDATLPTQLTSWTDELAKLVRRGQRDGSIKKDVSAAAVARVSVASFFGINEVSARLTDRKDLLKRIDEWWTVMRAYLTTD